MGTTVFSFQSSSCFRATLRSTLNPLITTLSVWVSLLTTTLAADVAALEGAFVAQSEGSQATQLVLKGFTWDTLHGQPEFGPFLGFSAEEAEDAGYWIVQGFDRGHSQLRSALTALDCTVFDYLPNNAFAVRVPTEQLPNVRGFAQAVLPVHPGMKLDPNIGQYGTSFDDGQARHLLSVEFWPDQDPVHIQEVLQQQSIDLIGFYQSGRYLRAQVRLEQQRVFLLARLACVQWIQESAPVVQRNNRARWIVQTNQFQDHKLWKKGVTGNNVVFGHIDGRIWEDSCFFNDPTGVAPGPTHRKVKWMSSGVGSDPHGTHTAGILAGDGRPNGNGLSHSGMAPDAALVHHSYFPNSSNFLTMLYEARSHGARIHSNSWGNDWTRDYDNWCRDIDAFTHDEEDALVVFSVTNGMRVKNPENAKSSLSVAATQTDDPSLIHGGGVGPTEDGRLKPELLAPGKGINSAAAGANCLTLSLSGTSMAAPMVAGGAALLKQYFEDGYWPTGVANAADGFTPTGSLLRAALVHSGVDMPSSPSFPNYEEGWGRVLLDNVAFFAGDNRKMKLVDVRHAQGVSAGGTHTHQFFVPGGKHLRVTLAFADEPAASMAADPTVNDLDLVLIAPLGSEYHGNIFSYSGKFTESRQTTTASDKKNTLEQIFINAPPPGFWTLEVRGANVPVGPQGYAVVLSY